MRFCDDFHALGLEGPDGYLDVLFHQDEDRSAAGAFSLRLTRRSAVSAPANLSSTHRHPFRLIG